MSEITCPRCGRKNSDMARRCQGCALDLTDLSELSGVRRPETPSQLSLPPRNLMSRGIQSIDLNPDASDDAQNDFADVDSNAPTMKPTGDELDDERDPQDESRINSIPSHLRRRWSLLGRARMVAVFAFVVVFLGAAWLLFGRAIWPACRVTTQLIRTDRGEFIEFALSNVDPGTTVLFAGEKKVVDKRGHAIFPYYVQGLSFGENNFDLKITLPSGRELNETVSLDVPFRVLPFWHRYDFESNLLPIRVQGYAGTRVTINEVSTVIGSDQLVSMAIPVPYQDGVWDEWVRLNAVIERKGVENFDGTLRLFVKKAPLVLVAPPMEAVTERTALAVVGQVNHGAEVTVQKKNAPVVNGSFESIVELPTLGVQHVEVIAREQGFLPNRLRIPITRVLSLREAYAEYRVVDQAAVNWKELWLDPEKFVGTRLELAGSVRQIIPVQGGVLFQLIVEPCLGTNSASKTPSCLFWVNYPMSSDLHLKEQVHVRGRVAGERPTQPDKPTELMQEQPLLEAAFVLQQSD